MMVWDQRVVSMLISSMIYIRSEATDETQRAASRQEGVGEEQATTSARVADPKPCGVGHGYFKKFQEI